MHEYVRPPEIPHELIPPGEQMRYYNPVPHREDAPYILRDKVCWPDSCGNKETDRSIDSYEAEYDAEYHLNVCRHCGGILFTSVWRCPSCDDIYIKDFVDSRWCLAFPLCWNCLTELSPQPCVPHGHDASRIVRNRTPLGLNPPPFEESELDDLWAAITGD